MTDAVSRGHNLSIVSPEIARLLSDSKADVRKRGAGEVDRKVKTYCEEGDWETIHNLIRTLRTSFSNSIQNSLRKGGLLALSAVGIALNKHIGDFVIELVDAAIELFTDHDSTVRYHAAEALYNIAKIARGLLLVQFREIFAAMCNLKCDNDRSVQGASDSLDSILRDIATECKEFNVDLFVKTIRTHIHTTNPRIRQYVLSWLMLMDTVPDISLTEDLPQFLEGVMDILGDPERKIASLAEQLLSQYLARLQQMQQEGKTVCWGEIINIVIKSCRKKDDVTRNIAINWAVKILSISNEHMLPYMPDLLKVFLSSMSDPSETIRSKAGEGNTQLAGLYGLVRSESYEFKDDIPEGLTERIMSSLAECIHSSEIPTKSSALEWLQMVLEGNPELASNWLFPELLNLLGDPSDQVVELSLHVLAMITQGSEESFHKFLSELISLFEIDSYKLMSRVSTIVRTLARITPCENLFRMLARILSGVPNLAFVSSMVTSLNLILLTSPELLPFRNILKRGLEDQQASELFKDLYYCWSYNAVSLVSLCLISKAYKHSYELIRAFGEQEITVATLVQIDKLVQLLESPVFTFIRLALLEPEENPYLIKALYGILMLLPQSSAFDDLHKRLKSVNTLCNLNSASLEAAKHTGPKSQEVPNVDWDKLLAHYKLVEEEKETYARAKALK
eukprot:TRINITY_DN3596_c0_g1_i1.p1 TRINITY_DN3596_c0_g1~~TRINITY_DN3596_c0_g1_i1.p1  ORF type:complete len:710 (+),score=133.44 TRINITY_DN3596_c0_g1_i1:94-2130(+)